MVRKERKWNNIKCSTTKDRKKIVKDKNRNKEQRQNIEKAVHMVDINSAIWINTLNVNGLNAPNKKDYQSESKKKTQVHFIYKKPIL